MRSERPSGQTNRIMYRLFSRSMHTQARSIALRLIGIPALAASFAACGGSEVHAVAKHEPNDIMSKEVINMEGMDTITLGAGCFWCVEAVFVE